MASREDFPDKCAICQEEYNYSLPRADLHVIRAKECALHFVHEDCALDWFRQQHKCPVCSDLCTEIVDINGETLESFASQSVTPQPIEPYVFSYFQNELMQLIDMARCAMRASLKPNELLPIEKILAQNFLGQYAGQCSEQSNCQFCGRPCSLQKQAITVPCAHKFHSTCLYQRLIDNGGICPAEQCGAEVAVAGHPIFELTEYHFNRTEVDALLKQAAGEPHNLQPPACQICNDAAGDEERVITPTCSHIFHSRCFDAEAGSGEETVRLCPVCQRECLDVIRLLPQPKRVEPPEDRQEATPTPTPSMTSTRSDRNIVVCTACKQEVPLTECVRPNTCNHPFHRSCLVRKTKSKRECPRRGCKKKFRNIEDFGIMIEEDYLEEFQDFLSLFDMML